MLFDRRRIATRTALLSLSASIVGCSDAAPGVTNPELDISPTASASRSNDACQNVYFEGEAKLGLVEVAPGVFALGAIPAAVTMAGIPGMLGSIVTGAETSGSKGQGAQHLTLIHTFTSAIGNFSTADQAVCAPAGTDPGICRVNDVLSVAAGTGVFANATGKLHNHGIINLNTQTLAFSARGRICGDGL